MRVRVAPQKAAVGLVRLTGQLEEIARGRGDAPFKARAQHGRLGCVQHQLLALEARGSVASDRLGEGEGEGEGEGGR